MKQAVIESLRNRDESLTGELLVPGHDDTADMLVKEMQHRLRNILSVVQCLVSNTNANTADDYRTALSTRIATLSDAYAILDRPGDQRVSLVDLLERTLKPHAMFPRDRIVLAGPDLAMEPRIALSLHVVFHELATNASKHGALTSTRGTVEVLWEIAAGLGSGQTLVIQWRERGGPRVEKPKHQGFGTRLIARAISGARVDLEFAPDGLVCRLLVDLGQTSTAHRGVS